MKEGNELKTLIFSMSLNGEVSVTLASTRYLSDVYTPKGDVFDEIIMPKNGVVSDEMLAKFAEADLVVFATSMYHFLIASQAMDAMATIGEYMKQNCPGKPVTYFMTSNFLMDVLVHRYVESWTKQWGMRYIKGVSIFSDDMQQARYRADVFAWYNNVKAILAGDTKVKKDMTVRVVVLDKSDETNALAQRYMTSFKDSGANASLIDMTQYNFKHCLGCQYCYTERKCCIKDDFNKLAQDIETNADAIVYVGAIESGFYPVTFKRWMDRHVCMGRCPLDDEIITIYAWHKGDKFISGDDETFKQWATACTSFGGEVLIGVYEGFTADAVNSAVAAFNESVGPYRDFYRAALYTRFADLARVIQNVEPLDYKYFDSNGAYAIEPKNENCRSIHSAEDARISVDMKSMQTRMFREHTKDLDVPIPERRKMNRGQSMIECAIDPPYKNFEGGERSAAPAAPAAGPMMGKMMKKVGKRMGFVMNTFNTLVFSTIGTLSSGHASLKSWLIGAGIGWLTGALITSIVDVKDTQDWVLAKTKLSDKTFKGRAIASLTTSVIIFPLMTVMMGVAMPMLSAKSMETGVAQTRIELMDLKQQQYDLKTQQYDLKLEQADLKSQQAVLVEKKSGLESQRDNLQAQLDEMLVDVNALKASLEKAATPAEKGPISGQLEGKQKAADDMQAGIDGINNGIAEVTGGIEGQQKGIDEMQSGIEEMQSGIDGMQGGIDGMTQSIEGRTQAIEGIKSGIPKSLPLSAFLMSVIGIILGIFTQPFFTKAVMKSVFGKNMPPM